MQHLWESNHAYYCADSNYFASGNNQPGGHYKSWAEFHEEFGDADIDYNLLFRWDWREGEGWGAASYNGDDYYRNGHLMLCWLGQRKGLYRWDIVEVCRADEPAVLEFLRPRWEYLKALWEPMELPTPSRAEGERG